MTCVAYSADPAVRNAAAEALRTLDPLGRAPTVAAIHDASARATAAAALRRELLKDPTKAETSARELSE